MINSKKRWGNVLDIIFDIDGTIMNIDHRRHFLDERPKNWNSFFKGISDDVPNQDIARLMLSLLKDKNNQLIFCSGRKETYREITQNQVARIIYKENTLALSKFLKGDKLNLPFYMREDEDYRPDYMVKSDLLDNMINDGYDPAIVFDDRDSVVEMWRSRGIRCLQVAEGKF